MNDPNKRNPQEREQQQRQQQQREQQQRQNQKPKRKPRQDDLDQAEQTDMDLDYEQRDSRD